MTQIIYDDELIELQQGQTVLSALLERGHKIANSCRAGVCQTCLMQATDGEIPANAQTGLKDTLKSEGYFLACCCEPQSPLHIASGQPTILRSKADVIEHETIGKDVLRLRLKPHDTLAYRAGQYITAWKDDTQGRNYSLASVAELDDHLECHIRRIPDGLVSNWLHDEVKTGDTLQIQEPIGQCFYTPGSPEQTLLLAGTGTGLAPLIGIARDALRQGHSGAIHLVHGARKLEDLYMHQTLLDMAMQYSQFHYYASVLQGENREAPITTIPIDQQLINIGVDLTSSKIFLCGDADIVNLLKRKLFLAGARMNNINSDAFIRTSHG